MSRLNSLAIGFVAGTVVAFLAISGGLMGIQAWPGVPGHAAGVMTIAVRDPMVVVAGDLACVVFAVGLCLAAIGRANSRRRLRHVATNKEE